MARAKKKPSKAKTKKQSILDTITPDDAASILKTLAEEDTNIAKRIEQLAMEYLSDVNIEDIADQVYWELNSIDVEDVWDRSGSTRHGYIEPHDMAWQIFEETLEPFLKELKKYQKLSMLDEAKYYCMGILKGIYRFEEKATSEYKDWAVDAPGEYFYMVLDDWKKDCKNLEHLNEMAEFIRNNFPEWAR